MTLHASCRRPVHRSSSSSSPPFPPAMCRQNVDPNAYRPGTGASVTETQGASSSVSSHTSKTTVDEKRDERKKTTTVLSEEKSYSQLQKESHKVISGRPEEVAPLLRAEGFHYEPPKSAHKRSSPSPPPPLPKSVPVSATETRKMAFTTTTPDYVSHLSFCFLLSKYIVTLVF